MSPFVKNFIENFIDLIDTNQYTDLYYEWCGELNYNSPDLFHSVYTALLDAGIDMLLYMKELPDEFFLGYKTSELIIPDNITVLGEDVFKNCVIDRLVIPPSITLAGNYLFTESDIGCIRWTGSPDLKDNAFDGNGFLGTHFQVNQGSSIDDALHEFSNPPFTIEYV